ncbi:murein biosynthesis integral membrane protein MurJ [Sulfobacillus harzensis]|uniref:Murein biosynthesis integral membrane protein MurJ n=1 Tax=Sulfobacillus harzensis TaxID=2729629 RepID=A0A7Y0Q4F9_9FIRM|nr:murein biosynthesis integral membrane protein MurJ [Sulfobacillus harzensis]NMP24587.1 murein biosynthesis integral membrane protein MurJ [Sulfobacillus harzensis]
MPFRGGQAASSLRRNFGSVAGGTLLLSGAGLISKILGFFRQWLMAALFGVSAATDSWLVASIIPSLLFEIMGGTFGMVMVPLLAGRSDDADTGAPSSLFLDEVYSWTLVIGAFLTGLLELMAPAIVHVIAPGFQFRYPLTVLLLRIMVPAGFFLVLGNFINGILQSQRVYHTVAITPALINAVRIATMVTLGIRWHIVGVAIGFVAANAAQLAYLVPALERHNIHLHWRLTGSHPWTRQYLKLAVPTFLSHMVQIGGTVVDRIFASTLAVGRIAAMNFSQVLAQMPLTLGLTPFMTTIYAELSHAFNQTGSSREFREWAQHAYEVVLVIMGPFTLGLVFWRLPLVALLYEHGRFNHSAALLTSRLVLFWALSLPGEGLGIVGARILLAQRHTRSASIAGVIAMASNVVGDFLLVRPLGAEGLVIATGLAGWVRVAVQTGWLIKWR